MDAVVGVKGQLVFLCSGLDGEGWKGGRADVPVECAG